LAKLTEDQKTRIVELYVSGQSTMQIAPRFQVSVSTINNLLHRRNVVLRCVRDTSTKYQLRHDAFDELTPDAAYWIGFLFADGSVFGRENAMVALDRKAASAAKIAVARDTWKII
jgi:hypothetical protein